MFSGVRVSPLVVALAMFVCCLASGMGARWLIEARVDTPARRGNLVVHVRDGSRAVHVRNLTDLAWTECVATVESGAVSPPFALGAGGATRVPLSEFHRAGSVAGLERRGEGALRTTSVVCRGAGGAPQEASLR